MTKTLLQNSQNKSRVNNKGSRNTGSKFKEAKHSECDKIKNHENYASCIEAEMRDKIFPDLGCMVPWISMKDQCIGHIKRLAHHERILHWLLAMVQHAWGGSEYESKQCPLPCTLVSAQAKFLQSIAAGTNYSYFGIQFAQQVRIYGILT